MYFLGTWQSATGYKMDEEEDGKQIREKVEKYMRMLNNDSKIGHALRRLATVDMTLELLSETGVGKAVNQLRNHEQYGEKALKIVEKWKDMARSYGLKQRRRRSVSPTSEQASSSKKMAKEKRKEKKENNVCESTCMEVVRNGKEKLSNNEIENVCSGLSFADMLARADTAKPFKPKRMKADCNEWKSCKVDINYRPSKVLNFEPTPKEHRPTISEAASMDAAMFKPRKSVRKIYAGRSRVDGLREVPTLQNICIKLLIANIDAIEEVGDTPYFLLKPVLEKCSLNQLCSIERRNPQLMEDTDELWEKFVNRTFPKYETKDDETWRECYHRICNENDRKLKMLSSKITQHNKQTSAPVKTALLADAKAPREVRRRQMRYGTQNNNCPLPSASEISKARKDIFDKGSKEALASLPHSVRNINSPLGSHLEKKTLPKKGALMIKTLKMLKGKRR
ncbi:unnamed protein product [Thelazia callipaeda]|uniref:TFIIS N-terminal domain-containing protein n=1 Tax=Thelazia callipaeda TaxID=103827 RepID=A0A0N5CJF9_THECL|nr:unnamed protein product [Thelazia callipaeda]